jgi:hypothetical protein
MMSGMSIHPGCFGTVKTPPSEASVKQLPLMLPHYVGAWEDDDLNKRATVVLLLPGCEEDDFHIKVSSGGRQLEMVMDWPELMLNPLRLLQLLGHPVTGHNKAIALKKSVKKLRSHETDTVKSCMLIPLPFQCEEQLCEVNCHGLSFVKEKGSIMGEYNIRMVLIELMGLRDNYRDVRYKARTVECDSAQPPVSPQAFSHPPSQPYAYAAAAAGHNHAAPPAPSGFATYHYPASSPSPQQAAYMTPTPQPDQRKPAPVSVVTVSEEEGMELVVHGATTPRKRVRSSTSSVPDAAQQHY